MLRCLLPSLFFPWLDCTLVCFSKFSLSHVRQAEKRMKMKQLFHKLKVRWRLFLGQSLPVVHWSSFTLFSTLPYRQFQLDIDEAVLEWFGQLGEASKKKTGFFSSEKLQNSETPPSQQFGMAEFFLIRKFWNWRDPHPPFWWKIPKYSQFFFFDNIPMDWVRAPFLAKISQYPHFLW